MRILCASDTTIGGRYAAYFADRLATRADGEVTLARRADLAEAARTTNADLVIVAAEARGPFGAWREARRNDRLCRDLQRPVIVLSPLALLPASGVVVAGFEVGDDVDGIVGTGAWLAAR